MEEEHYPYDTTIAFMFGLITMTMTERFGWWGLFTILVYFIAQFMLIKVFSYTKLEGVN